jgi:two-component system sensor kinase FixL
MPEPRLVPVELVPLLEDVLQSVDLGGAVRIERQFVEPVPRVWGDPRQLPLVFRNLVRNAREAMPGAGTLTLSLTPTERGVAIVVADTGVGIRDEDLARVTEPLYSTKARGMGLGLAIARAIVEKNRGWLTITSRVGEGSQFSVELQRVD